MRKQAFFSWIGMGIVIPLLFSGCVIVKYSGSKNCIKGSGIIITEERPIRGVCEVVSAANLNVFITEGEEERLFIEGDNNIVPLIQTKVSGDSLLIYSEESYSTRKGLAVVLTLRELEKVELTGSGKILGETPFHAEKISFFLTGSGDMEFTVAARSIDAVVAGSGSIRLSGEVEKYNCTVTGSGEIYSYGMKADYCDASVTGSGEIEVFAGEALYASISGSGEIYYKGRGSVSSEITGSGSIRKR